MHSLSLSICKHHLLKLAATSLEQYEAMTRMVPRDVHSQLDPTKKKVREYWGGGVYGPSHLIQEALELKKKLPKDKAILTSDKDPKVFAHELGHAQFDKSTIGGALQHPKVRGLAPLISAGAGLTLGMIASNKSPLLGAVVGGSINALGHAPTLISEGMASMKALDNLRSAGASDVEIQKAKREMGKWFLTYMKEPLVSTTLVAAASAIRGVSQASPGRLR